MASMDAKTRLQALRNLLQKEGASTQEELREALERLDCEVTQSTISRDLRRLGATKMTDGHGRTIYRLIPEVVPALPFSESFSNLVLGIRHNGSLIVMNTTPGSASLLARHIDQLRSPDIMGTIAGDDTIFVAPVSLKKIEAVKRFLETHL